MEDIESGRDPSPYRGHTSHRAGPEEEEGLEKVLLELNVAPNLNVEAELRLEAEPGVEMTPGWGRGYDQLSSAYEGEPENSRRSITEIQIPAPSSGFFHCTVRIKLECEKCERSCKIHKKNKCMSHDGEEFNTTYNHV
ncbi:peroxisome proliferator-activated receptor delta [Tachysurus ichikawai]